MALNVRIITTNAEFRRQIFEALKKKESTILNVAQRSINDFIRETISEMMNHPAIRNLINDKRYRGQIGVKDIGVQLRFFLRKWLKHLKPKIQWFPSNQSFELTFRLDEDVYDNLTAEYQATFFSEQGFEIEWLKWLLLAGHRRVVTGYHFLFYKMQQKKEQDTGRFKRAIRQSVKELSRTGYGIMVKNGKRGPQDWGVPTEISGTSKDNIFTRVLDATIHKFQGFLEKRMEQYFGE